MWIFEHEEKTSATPERIWAQWANVEGWPRWDENLEWVKSEGPLASGTFARLRPKGAREVAFEFQEVDEPRRFIDITLLPQARMVMEHRIEVRDGQTVVYQSVRFTGALGRVFAYVIGRGMKRDMPVAMRKMIELAEAA